MQTHSEYMHAICLWKKTEQGQEEIKTVFLVGLEDTKEKNALSGETGREDLI